MDIMLPILEVAPQRVKILLFQVPQQQLQQVPLLPRSLVTGLLETQPVICELVGVYHAKFCVFDKQCLLSGANLSEEYFTQRQDRYMRVISFSRPNSNASASEQGQIQGLKVAEENESPLATFLQGLLSSLEKHCYGRRRTDTCRSRAKPTTALKTSLGHFYDAH